MSDFKSLDHLGPITDEMLGGLHADEAMRLRIKRAAAEGGAKRRRAATGRLVPAAYAALALICAGTIGARISLREETGAAVTAAKEPAAVQIETIAAGDGAATASAVMLADLGDGAQVRKAAPAYESLFAGGDGDIPMVSVGGGVYRLLETPRDIGASLLGSEVGSVAQFTKEPSLAADDALAGGLSNVAAQGSAIYSVRGLDTATVVAVRVDGRMRLFQRVSYAGRGPGGESLEDTFDVRGRVKEVTLSGVGTLTGSKANEVIAVLLDQATLRSADATARKQSLTVTLDNGLRLQLGVSGDTLCGCGGWSCPEFFEAFEAAL